MHNSGAKLRSKLSKQPELLDSKLCLTSRANHGLQGSANDDGGDGESWGVPIFQLFQACYILKTGNPLNNFLLC